MLSNFGQKIDIIRYFIHSMTLTILTLPQSVDGPDATVNLKTLGKDTGGSDEVNEQVSVPLLINLSMFCSTSICQSNSRNSQNQS